MYLKKILCLAAVLLLTLVVPSQAVDDSLNVQEIGHIPSDTIGGLYDVWGWYDAANSKYYALICNYSQDAGLILIETTDPSNPDVIDTLGYGDLPHIHAADVKVSGDYAFLASEKPPFHFLPHSEDDTSYILIYYLPDAVSNPDTYVPTILNLIDNEDDPAQDVRLRSCHNLFVTWEYLFLAEGWRSDDDTFEVAVLRIRNGATPDNPSLLTTWTSSDFDTGVYTWPHDFYAQGDTAFIFAFKSGVYRVEFDGSDGDINSWTKIWYDRVRGDVVNSNPFGTFDCNDETLDRGPTSHSGWLTDDGRYLVVGDEGGNEGSIDCNKRIAPCLRVFDVDDFWDVSDPSRDTTISLANAFDIIWDDAESADEYIFGAVAIDEATDPDDITPCPFGTGNCGDLGELSYMGLGVHNPLIKGRLVFNAWYSRGLQILDITDIDTMKHAGFYDHGIETSGGPWKGEAFGVYPFSPDGYIYVSGSDGLYIYRYGYTGVLDTNATWAGDIYIYDTLTVADTSRLVIEAGTNLYMFEDALLKIDGTLIANGTSSDSIKFIVLGGAPKSGDWKGIYLSTNAACTLSYCSITKAYRGIDMADSTDAKITFSNISTNSSHGIYVDGDGGKLYVARSTLNRNSTGVYLRENSLGIIKTCTFYKNVSAGVINYKGELHMTASTVEDSGIYGLLAHESTDSVSTTTFINGKYGIRIYGDTDGVYEDCSITHPSTAGSSYYGIYAFKSPSTMPRVFVGSDSINGFFQGGIYFSGVSSSSIITETKVVSSGTYGVYYKDTAGDIVGGTGAYNLFEGHTNGLYITGSSSSPTVRRTKFWDNSSEGAYVASGSWADFGTTLDFGNNSFKNANPGLGYHDLHNANSTSVDAIKNYWGEVPPNLSQLVNVKYFPYLLSDPLPAKVAPGEDPGNLPEDFALAISYPNPFNPTTAISFNLSSPQAVTLRIYNIMGQEVRRLIDGPMPAGQNTVIWDGRNSKGEYVSSGIYLCQMRTIERQKTLKMTVLR